MSTAVLRGGIAALIGVILGVGLWQLLLRPPALDLDSYGGGWGYVMGRQGPAGWTNHEALHACTVYSDGFAQLDGYRDGQAFLQGCQDALGHYPDRGDWAGLNR